MADAVALVVAAGRGERFGAGRPKQYLPLAGRPLLRHCLEAFGRHPAIAAIRVVIGGDDAADYAHATAGLKLLPPVTGGATRQESVRNGLESLVPLAPERVLIHDAVRPLLDRGVIDRVLAALDRCPGAIAALPVADSLKRSDEGGTLVAATVDRSDLWRAQTPQGFRFRQILAAHRAQAGAALSDDAAVAEAAGLAVALVPGAADNLKITTADDLRLAERWLAAALEYRTGTGFDVHRFGPGRGVRLCGVELPHDRGLLGHSDADVGLHALTDAVLGALGAGDIGRHFPPGEARWRGADSALFLAHARALVAGRQGRIVHLDLTLICEQPRIGAHREAMVRRVAEIAGVAPHRVSIKATTTEGLGFTGRGEGIAAQAVATVALPAADSAESPGCG